MSRNRVLLATLPVVAVLTCGVTPGSAVSTRQAPVHAVARLWPAALPHWFWGWARWHLGRGEFADAAAADPALRPGSAPRYVPEWAWQRLAAIAGDQVTQVPRAPLERGAVGPAVMSMQRAGIFGTKTRYGVIAFEKAHQLERDGVVDPDEWVRIVRSLPPPAPHAERDAVFIDLSRQILFDVRHGSVARVLPVSTGGGYTYTGLDGRRHVAVTPVGSFNVYRKVPGNDRSYLGTLYYPSYFVNGYAVHGSPSVPAQPGSHGCVRIPLWLAERMYRRMRIGTTVVVAR
jgi:N-acetylmuramoyl-L-alanine amidase